MARVTRVPDVGAEILRFLLVVFGAALGYYFGSHIESLEGVQVLGVFDASIAGVIVGAGLGFSLGGVISRQILKGLNRSDTRLDAVPPDEVVAGFLGSLIGMAGASLLTWPLLLLGPALVMAPLFAFCVLIGGIGGYNVGRRRGEAVIGGLGGPGGVATREAAAWGPKVLDTSVAIDGRVLSVARAGFLTGSILVPQAVVGELQGLADSPQQGARARGRRGLDVLVQLKDAGVVVEVIRDDPVGIDDVDAKLVQICLRRQVALITLDQALADAAGLAGVRVLNLHELAKAMAPPVGSGDTVDVHLARQGKEHGQAVGHLVDGTMVVVQDASDRIGDTVRIRLTSVTTTSHGRLVFGVIAEGSR